MLFNVFPLVNTCHALGFNAFLMVDALTFFRCHLRAIENEVKCYVFQLIETMNAQYMF